MPQYPIPQYKIIDEPKTKPQQHLIVNPLIILLVGMFLPMVWAPPFYAQTWGPLLWISINGYLLGSFTLKYEVIIAVVGGLLWFALPLGSVFGLLFLSKHGFISQGEQWINTAVPYLRIASQAVFFFTLYLIVFKQTRAYELFCYLKERTPQ